MSKINNKSNFDDYGAKKGGWISKSHEKRVKSQKAKSNEVPRSKEETTVISIINDNAPISMKKISQKAKISMSKCAILINNLIKNKVLDKKDVIDAPK